MVLLVGKMQITAVKIRPAFSRTSDARHSVPRRVAVRSEYSSGPSSSSQTPGGSPTPEFGSQAAIPPPSDRFSSGSNEPIGSKLQKWMENPLTFLAMGPRAGLGALTSATEVVNRIPELQAEFEERMNFVINDPRPVSEKQEAIAKELESTLAELISTGEKVETDVLSQLSAQLPPEVLDAIPKDLKDAFPGLQPITEADPFSGEWEVAADETFTYSPGTNYEDPKPSSAPDLSQLKDAASAVRKALEEIQSSTDPSKRAMLKVNLTEARDLLKRRTQELNTGDISDPSVKAAVAEASRLIAEVDSLNF
uniref:Uncharacterized protein n=1 Tax=Tetraselmis sp. GSL018 TaxID=582737 RepID=A0A061R8U5_9CHLO|eukprot:CAMPEP_0177597724 /NCGR_PEP_ID=MMETSP0419_2-20121207/11883_1 /TAXON_ID=582737 /ORGANISM="Tetraselmis sp., Strain GSL018" /LENGTH=308 /DNA_ID=CAMNT_0019089951 /DNA_START=78 /DNA_END=1004 /DNA_ORIENTATION=+